jgi:HlyD family secretion protein
MIKGRTGGPLLALLLAVGLAAWWFWHRSDQPAVNYRTAEISKGAIVQNVYASGTVNPRNLVRVGAQVTGTIEELLADENDRVVQGQIIAQIDQSLFSAEVNRSQAEVHAAEAETERLQAVLRNLERTFKRRLSLRKRELIAQEEVDDAETEVAITAAQLAGARARLSGARAALFRAETNLAYTVIRSPIDGVVIARDVEVGQTVVSSLQAPSLFLLAEDLSEMQVEGLVDEADIGGVAPGQPLRFTVDAWPDLTIRTSVDEIQEAARVEQNVVSYPVLATVDNTDLRLKPGMTANISIEVARKEDCLRIPNAALRFRPRDPGPGRKALPARTPGYEETVWILGRSGLPQPVPVSTGLSNDEFSELLSGELAAGDQVIVAEDRQAGRKGSSRRTRLRFF